MKFKLDQSTWQRCLAYLLAGLVTLWLSGFAIPSRLRGEDKPPDLPPEVSTKLDDFNKKLMAAMRKRLDAKMDALIGDVFKATGLGEDGVAALKKGAAKAEDDAQGELSALFRKEFSKQYAANPSVLEGLEHSEIIEMAATTDRPEGPEMKYTQAPDQPAWKEALKRTLTPEQAAAWAKASPKPDDTAERKAIDTYLDAQAEQTRARIGGPILATCDNINAVLGLPKERADAVAALANQAVDASVATSRKSTVETLLRYDKATRDRIMKNQGAFYTNQNGEGPEDQAGWKEGLARLLTDEERARLKVADESHAARRVQALGQLLVQMLDEKVAFTQDQRVKIQGVAEKLVKTQKAFFPNQGENTYFRFDPSMFYKVAKEAKAEEIRPLLDAPQWQHWQEISNNPAVDDGEQVQRAAIAPAPGKDPAPASEPEDMEAAVADYLVRQGEAEHKRANAHLLLQAEDATRVAGLDAEPAAHLRTAALGAAEAATTAWLTQTESNLRSEIQGATPENIPQKIAGMSRYSFSHAEQEENAFWKGALNTAMSDPQRKAWQAARDERAHYSAVAIAGLVGAELDRKLSLTPEEWQRLQPILTRALEDYGPDIRANFTYYSSPWYLQSYTLYTPLHAVPDQDLKLILSPAQYKTWTTSSECSYSSNYWENIHRNHDQRVKEKKS